MKKPPATTLVHSIVTAALTIGLSYFGYEKYEASQESSTTTITIEAPTSGDGHSHGAVVSQNEINQLIRNSVSDAIKKQDEKNNRKFPLKESWD